MKNKAETDTYQCISALALKQARMYCISVNLLAGCDAFTPSPSYVHQKALSGHGALEARLTKPTLPSGGGTGAHSGAAALRPAGCVLPGARTAFSAG